MLENNAGSIEAWKLQVNKYGIEFKKGIKYNGSVWLKGDGEGKESIYFKIYPLALGLVGEAYAEAFGKRIGKGEKGFGSGLFRSSGTNTEPM